MPVTSKRAQLALGILCVGIIAASTTVLARAVARQHADAPQAATDQPRAPFSHALPHLDGDRLKATVVEVTYAPGESDPPHSHPCPVMVYVIEGSYRSQVKGQPEAIYHPGESFYEPPTAFIRSRPTPATNSPQSSWPISFATAIPSSPFRCRKPKLQKANNHEQLTVVRSRNHPTS